MGIVNEKEIIDKTVMEVAEKMVLAARTAPKTRGKNTIEALIIKGKDKKMLADQMKHLGKESGAHYFRRDAENILAAPAIVLLGTRIKPMDLPSCGLCGYPDCKTKKKHPENPCTYNSVDLGIAIGSAVSVAMDHRVDNRVMYTIGMAALKLKWLGSDVKIVMGIPLSATSKNIFFDRK